MRMKNRIHLLLFSVFCNLSIAQTPKKIAPVTEKDLIQLTILQFNDFYEIAPLEGGKTGGAARIATVRKKLLAENPNTFTVLSGDFLSPTLLGTLKLDGERVNGKQMIEVLNKTGVDLVTFGNHEFDLDEASLQKRINESTFGWVSTNVIHLNKDSAQLFFKESNGKKTEIPKSRIVTFKNKKNKEFKIGIVAPCLPANRVKYVHYDDVFETVKKEIEKMEGNVDFIISLSHLSKDDDLKMAKMFPKINLILGGHEHENMKFQEGNTILTKADANAKTVYVHRIAFNALNKKSTITSSLVKLDETIIPDPEVNVLVEKWKAIENKIVRDMGFDPDEVLTTLPTPYDAREIILRNQPAEFCEMICKAMTKGTSLTHCSIMNSGSVRVDDVLKDKLSQYDILRSLPFGGGVIELDMYGRLLHQILDAGWANKGAGGFLQWDKITRDKDGKWFVGKELLNDQKTYHVAMNDFLLTGMEAGLEFLKKGNPDILIYYPPRKDDPDDLRNDIRMMIIDYLKKGGR